MVWGKSTTHGVHRGNGYRSLSLRRMDGETAAEERRDSGAGSCSRCAGAGCKHDRAARQCYLLAEAGRIVVELKNGCAFAFPPQLEASLRAATPEQLAAMEVESGGGALHWKELEAEIALSGFLAHLLNVRSWAASYMGRIRSPAKTAAARINAKKGGRPRKTEGPNK